MESESKKMKDLFEKAEKKFARGGEKQQQQKKQHNGLSRRHFGFVVYLDQLGMKK